MKDHHKIALDRIRKGDPNVLRALWKNMPSLYEVDTEDEDAGLELLRKICEAALDQSC
jgi:hypothetical protein